MTDFTLLDRLVDTAELRRRLGVSPSTLYRYRRRGLEFFRFAGKCLYAPETVVEFMRAEAERRPVAPAGART